jgi:cation diffusion facilitator CzcD-associated flavoprotein CzcO
MNKPVSMVQGGKLTIPSPDVLGFDPQEMRRKYDFERDRRLRPEGAAQYVNVEGDLDHLKDDTYITAHIERAPVQETIEVAILGGGFGGMLMAARLEAAGIRDFRIIERAGDFGGTWYWNRYPGAQCDVESYIYLPLLDETGYMPKEKYSFGPEIYAHAQRIGHHFDLYSRAFFQTQVREMHWDETDARWRVTTDRGDVFHARQVVISSGSLNRPKLPGIPGIRDFKGHTFHTSRWDYDYTGGSYAGGLLHKLGDKRVGIIGTGATGIQCIPHLGKAAGHLYVFQRTPSSVDERRNRPTDPAWFKTLTPGWQQHRNDNFTKLLVGVAVEEDLVNDGWTELFKSLGELQDGTGTSSFTDAEMKAFAEIVDFQHDNRVRARCDEVVKDGKTAEALKHWYRPWCKRPCFNDEYLPTFNRPNVTLVDTGGKGVDRLTAKGAVVDGVAYELDCLIFATGFEVSRATYTHQAELEIIGRNQTLGAHWANGMRTYHGLMSHGFPNLHHMGFTQTGYTPNFTYQLDKQAQHLAAVFTDTKARGIKAIEPTKQAEEDYLKLVMAPNAMTDYLANCTPGYYNAEGNAKANHDGFLQGHYPEGGLRFYEMLAEWRAKGDYAGLIVR